jgi:hypothetical protein
MQSGWLQHFMPKHAESVDDGSSQNGARPEHVSRRDFIQGSLVAGAAAGAAASGALVSQTVAEAQAPAASAETPIGPKWWPSRWGPQDEAGASNWITPAKVLEAARLIKTGKIYNLDRIYQSGIPAFGERVWNPAI